MDVLKLLQAKNRCLAQLLELSDEFVKGTAAGGHSSVESALPAYESRRQAILKAIDLFDRKINETVSLLPAADRTPALLESLRKDLQTSEALIQSVLTADDGVMSRIEDAKTELLRELVVSERNRAMVGKFKSQWVGDSGEEIDRKV